MLPASEARHRLYRFRRGPWFASLEQRRGHFRRPMSRYLDPAAEPSREGRSPARLLGSGPADFRVPQLRGEKHPVTVDNVGRLYNQMATSSVSKNSWRVADLSRTVNDGLLAVDCRKRKTRLADRTFEETRLEDLRELIDGLRELLVSPAKARRIFTLTHRGEVFVPDSIVELLSSRNHRGQIVKTLERLRDQLNSSRPIDDDEVALLDSISQEADRAASASMQPLMRK